MTRPAYEIADVFRRYGSTFQATYARLLGPLHLLALKALAACRTSQLGGHVLECNRCGHRQQAYNSCQNRHCPKCQASARGKWFEDRARDLLPVEYFHVVFTLPSELNSLTLQNKKVIYNLLFRATAETLTELAASWKDLKAEIGFFAILHTWGQKLDFHPHLHCVVPGGGIALDGTRWVSCPRGFLMPVKLMSRKFRGKFLALLKEQHVRGELTMKGAIAAYNSPAAFKSWLSPLYDKEWVVYAKPPWNGPQQVLKYLARYTHRIAISNERLLSIDGGQVTFSYKDYRHGHRQKQLTLSATEFIRRFMMHILPHGLMRIRYYGFLANARRKQKLSQIRQMLGAAAQDTPGDQADCQEDQDTAQNPCPHCQGGQMKTIIEVPRPTVPQILQLPLLLPI